MHERNRAYPPFRSDPREVASSAPAARGPAWSEPRGRDAEAVERAAASGARDDGRDFDFLHGQWIVEHRRLAEPWATPGYWASSEAIHACRPLLGSRGHIEEVASEDGSPCATLRLFDLEHRHWTIHSVSSSDGVLQPPLRGRFMDGVGTFVGESLWGGTPVLVRETWMRTADKPRSEHMFSTDGGATWELYWIRDFSRVHWPQ